MDSIDEYLVLNCHFTSGICCTPRVSKTPVPCRLARGMAPLELGVGSETGVGVLAGSGVGPLVSGEEQPDNKNNMLIKVRVPLQRDLLGQLQSGSKFTICSRISNSTPLHSPVYQCHRRVIC